MITLMSCVCSLPSLVDFRWLYRQDKVLGSPGCSFSAFPLKWYVVQIYTNLTNLPLFVLSWTIDLDQLSLQEIP